MDKANWSPEEIINLTKELNYYGTHYRNAVACLYNTFTYELADYWRGNNYNKVAQFVNEHYDDFDKITYNLCVMIPTIIQGIAQMQSEDGLGSVEIFSYEINLPGDGAVEFNLIPMTETSADGRITLTEELAKKYIDGNSEPSLPFYSECMEKYMDGYINTLEQFSGIKEFNEALKYASESVETYKIYSLQVSKDVIEETRLRADVELGKISDADANSKDLAVRVLANYEGDSEDSSISGTNYTASKGSSTSGTNYSTSTSSSTSGTNYTASKSPSTSGTNYTASKSSSTSGTNYSGSPSHKITKEEVEKARIAYVDEQEAAKDTRANYDYYKSNVGDDDKTTQELKQALDVENRAVENKKRQWQYLDDQYNAQQNMDN